MAALIDEFEFLMAEFEFLMVEFEFLICVVAPLCCVFAAFPCLSVAADCPWGAAPSAARIAESRNGIAAVPANSIPRNFRRSGAICSSAAWRASCCCLVIVAFLSGAESQFRATVNKGLCVKPARKHPTPSESKRKASSIRACGKPGLFVEKSVPARISNPSSGNPARRGAGFMPAPAPLARRDRKCALSAGTILLSLPADPLAWLSARQLHSRD